MTKQLIGLGLIVLSLSVVGCKGNAYPSKVQEKLINMEGYTCVASISSISEGNSNTYQSNQIYEMSGRYRVEVTKPEHIKGLTTICNGEKVIQYNPQIENPKIVELPVNNFRNQMFLGTFVQNYLQSEDVAIEVQKIEGGLTTMLEAVIPGGSKHMSTQRVWLNPETGEPVRMTISNQDDEETIKIEFIEFTYDPQINESIFMIK